MLTALQRDLLLYIYRRWVEDKISPSYPEMMKDMNIKSKNSVHRRLSELEERGFIKRLPKKKRAIDVIRLPGESNNDEN